MSKVLKVVGVVASVAAAVVTAGASLGISAALLSGIGVAASLGASLLAKKPRAPEASPADRNRLHANIDLRTPRVTVYGDTAMATDIRDEEYTGADGEFFHRFMVCAAHKVNSIYEIWFDNKLAWTAAGGVQGEFVGFLTVAAILEGSAANAINISARMGSTRRYTGMAYVHFRYKLTGNDSKSDSPFAQAVPTRVTIKGQGALIYDPRKDSDRGGSGTHRADDQSTWEWDDDAARNPALQLLHFLLGYRINGELSVGKGMPVDRINIASFITAANMCDEAVALDAGGTEPRYRTDGVFSEGDSMPLVNTQFKSSMNATLDDVDGQIRLAVLHNDLAVPIASFDEDDILDVAVDWNPQISLEEQFNIIRGNHTDPSPNSLYQSPSYPEIEIASLDGIDRIETINYPLVQSVTQCQRLAKQRLQRIQYSATFVAQYLASAWKVQKGDVISQTFAPLGFVNKLFRVVDTGVQFDGIVPMLLREEDANLYLWDREETASVVPAAPSTYDYQDNPLYQDIIQLGGDVLEALDLAAARGKLWVQSTAPDADESNLGDTWINEGTGVFYDRVPGSIVLGGKIVVLGGFRPSMIWTRATGQPLEDVISAADEAQTTANEAQSRVQAYDDDGTLDVSEKRRLISDNQQFEDAYDEILVSAATVGVASTALTAARSAYIAFRDAISPAWDDTSQDSPVVRDSLDGVINDYAAAIQKLRKDIEEAVQTLADAAQTRAQAGINADGTVKTGKVIKNSLADDIILQKKAVSGIAIDSTNTGAELAVVVGLDVKVSQGGFAAFDVDLNISGEPIASIDSRSVMYVAIERKPKDSGAYAFIEDGLLVYSNHAIEVPPDPAAGIDVGFAVTHLVKGAFSFYYTDEPPSDGEYNYRFTARKAQNGTAVSGSAVSATATNVYINARSEKVAT